MVDNVQAEPRVVLGSIPTPDVVQDPLAHAYDSANQYEQPHELTQWKSPVFPSDSVWQGRPASGLEQQVTHMSDGLASFSPIQGIPY